MKSSVERKGCPAVIYLIIVQIMMFCVVKLQTGRLTLTDYSMYFEKAGVLSYGEAKKFDLASDLKHEVKPDLTGPWGSRVFDKAVMFKSNEEYVFHIHLIPCSSPAHINML